MPRRWKAFIFLAALLVTTLSFASFASAHTDNVKVLHLIGHEVEFNEVDHDPASDGARARRRLRAQREPAPRRPQGRHQRRGVHLRPPENPPSALQCVISARIGSDQLTLQGLAFDQPRNVFAITGGTGRWRNAGGQAVVRDLPTGDSDITLFISDLG